MDQILTLLKSTAVFMLAAQLILHFGPGKQYEKYGKMIVAVIVLAQLAVPILSLGNKDMAAFFTDQLNGLEADNEEFMQKMEAMDEQGDDVVQNGLLESVEEKLSEEAQNNGVRIKNVRMKGEILQISVEADEGDRQSVSPVVIEKVRVGETEKKAEKQDRMRNDLTELFAGKLGILPEQMEVTEVG